MKRRFFIAAVLCCLLSLAQAGCLLLVPSYQKVAAADGAGEGTDRDRPDAAIGDAGPMDGASLDLADAANGDAGPGDIGVGEAAADAMTPDLTVPDAVLLDVEWLESGTGED